MAPHLGKGANNYATHDLIAIHDYPVMAWSHCQRTWVILRKLPSIQTDGGVGNGWSKQGVSKVSLIGVSEPPMDDTSSSGAGGSSRGASLRASKGGSIVLVDSTVGAAMLVSGAATAVRADSSIVADNVRSAAPGGEGDIGPLLADGRSESVAAGKPVAGTGTPAASARKIAGAARLATSGASRIAASASHIGIALRNFKRRTLKLASVRRDIPRHDCGLELASGLTSGWVIIHQ